MKMKGAKTKMKDSQTEMKRAYRAIYNRTKKYGYAKREELLKKGYSSKAICAMICNGIIFEPREGYLKPTSKA